MKEIENMKVGDKVKFRDPDLAAWTGTVTEVGRTVVYVDWTDGRTSRVRKESTFNVVPA